MKRGCWLTVLVLASLALAACSAGPDFSSIVNENPEDVVTINKLSGDNADLFLQSLQGFCPEMDEEEVYRVQIVGDNKTITKVVAPNGQTICEVDTSDPNYAQNAVAVMVNGERISLAEVQNAIQNLPQQQRAQNAGTVVNNMVNQILLQQEAKERGITVTDQEANQAVAQALNQSQVPPGQLNQQDIQRLRQNMKDQLRAQKLTQQVVQQADTTVTQQETSQYYEDNKDNMTLPRTWSIRHIQINIGDRSAPQTLKKAQTVRDLLNTTDFCDLVSQFSDDTQSADRCGRYTFASGDMLPSIEEEVKKMSEGETRIVKSRNAYHILQLEGVDEPRQASLEEVRDQIRNFLQAQKQQQALQDYINQLRNESEIVSYLG